MWRAFWMQPSSGTIIVINIALCDRVSPSNYLDILEDKEKFTLCRFRTTNHRLPVEVGRWKKIIRENRFCHLCSRRELGDEYHYIFDCTEFINERKLYFEFVHINRYNIIKYNNLMSSKSIYTLSKLCKFIRIVNKRICPLGWSTSFHNSIFV